MSERERPARFQEVRATGQNVKFASKSAECIS